jgi:hypothetical protein
MKFIVSKLLAAALVTSAVLTAAGSARVLAASEGPACDRACLSGFITKYLDALTAHDPARLPVTRDVRFTENGVEIPLGDALWQTIAALGSYRVDYLDTEAQQAAAHVAFVENDKPGLMALRLKIVDGKISEVETVLNRGAPAASAMPPIESLWTEAEPAATRLTRAELAQETENYLKAVSRSDGSLVKFSKTSCMRLENGNVMAYGPNDKPLAPLRPVADPNSWQAAVRQTMGVDCADQLSTGIYRFITSYDHARFPVIDVERQVVFGHWVFRRKGNVPGVTFKGKFYPFMDSMRFPNENLLGQAFKFRGGRITRVQGVFLNANVYKSGTGWDKR